MVLNGQTKLLEFRTFFFIPLFQLHSCSDGSTGNFFIISWSLICGVRFELGAIYALRLSSVRMNAIQKSLTQSTMDFTTNFRKIFHRVKRKWGQTPHLLGEKIGRDLYTISNSGQVPSNFCQVNYRPNTCRYRLFWTFPTDRSLCKYGHVALSSWNPWVEPPTSPTTKWSSRALKRLIFLRRLFLRFDEDCGAPSEIYPKHEECSSGIRCRQNKRTIPLWYGLPPSLHAQ